MPSLLTSTRGAGHSVCVRPTGVPALYAPPYSPGAKGRERGARGENAIKEVSGSRCPVSV